MAQLPSPLITFGGTVKVTGSTRGENEVGVTNLFGQSSSPLGPQEDLLGIKLGWSRHSFRDYNIYYFFVD